MKPRRIVISFDIETDLPVKVLREADISVPCENGQLEALCRSLGMKRGTTHRVLHPVNKPRVEVIQPVKKRKKDR